MARAAHAMAIENSKINAAVVEVQEFPHLAQMYQVMGVPKTVINNTLQFLGNVPEEFFIDTVLKAIGKAPDSSASQNS